MAAAGHAPRAEETAERASEGANAQAGTGKPAWRARALGSCASAASRRATHLLPHPRAARAHPRLPAREATAAACERPWQSPGRGGEWAEQPHLESAAAPHGRTCAQRCRLPPPAAAHRPPGGGWQRRRGSRPRGRSPGWPTWGRRSENAQRSDSAGARLCRQFNDGRGAVRDAACTGACRPRGERAAGQPPRQVAVACCRPGAAPGALRGQTRGVFALRLEGGHWRRRQRQNCWCRIRAAPATD